MYLLISPLIVLADTALTLVLVGYTLTSSPQADLSRHSDTNNNLADLYIY